LLYSKFKHLWKDELKPYSGVAFRIILILSVLTPSIVSTSTIAGYWVTRYFPWWTDGGNWLKHVNAIFGDTYPMWKEGTFQYPPIFFVLTRAVAKLTGDPITSLKLVALASFFIFPISMYFLSKKLFGRSLVGVTVAWLTAFFPLFLEFMGWGGYPNILAFAFLSIAFFFMTRYVEDNRLITINLILAAASVMIVILAHHLTSLILLGSLGLWFLLSLAFKGVERKHVGTLLIVALSGFLIYRLVCVWPSDFSFYNVAAYYRLRATVNFYYIFKNDLFLALFTVAFTLSILAMIRTKIPGYKARFMTAWMITPLLATQGYLFNVSLDYNRIFFFVFQPLMLLGSALALLIKPRELISVFDRTSPSFKQIKKGSCIICLTSIVVIGMLVSLGISISVATVNNINAWYSFIDPYGDNDKFLAVDWLAKNSNPLDTIVAEEPIGRWIEGYCKRRVLLHTPSWFLFMKGEVEREYAARALLTSQFGIRSMDVWVLEQSPYGYMSPIIAFNYLGDYTNTLFLSAEHSYLSLVESNQTKTVTLADLSEVNWVSRSNPEPAFMITHETSLIRINEKISMDQEQNITIGFNITKLQDTAKIENITLNFKFTSEIKVYDYYSENPSTLCIQTEAGELRVACNTPYTISGLSQYHFTFVFKNQASFELQFSLENLEGSASDVETYTWKEIADSYSVRYVVLPKFSLKNVDSLENNRKVPLEYSHLLNSTALTVAYENKRVIILEYLQS
jgi:hypothetical protein